MRETEIQYAHWWWLSTVTALGQDNLSESFPPPVGKVLSPYVHISCRFCSCTRAAKHGHINPLQILPLTSTPFPGPTLPLSFTHTPLCLRDGQLSTPARLLVVSSCFLPMVGHLLCSKHKYCVGAERMHVPVHRFMCSSLCFLFLWFIEHRFVSLLLIRTHTLLLFFWEVRSCQSWELKKRQIKYPLSGALAATNVGLFL